MYMFKNTLNSAYNFRKVTDHITPMPASVRSLLNSGLITTNNRLRRGLRKQPQGTSKIKAQMDVENTAKF